MLLGTELKTPFRWYDSLEKQNRFLPNCRGECLFQLFMPHNSLLPFQIRRQSVPNDEWSGEIATWRVYTLAHTMAYNLDAYVDDIVRFRGDGAMYFTYQGHLVMDSMQQGYYYSKIVLESGGELYSEVFFVNREIPHDEYLKLRWWNDCDVADMVYQFGGYKNEIWLATNIARNEPSLVEEGQENNQKQFIPTVQYYTDNFTLDEYVPEYVLSSLTLVNMHDHIEISEPKSGNLFVPVRNFKTTFEWTGTDCFCVATCKFQREGSYVKSRCCNNQSIERLAPYIVSELTNVSFTHGVFVGQGLGYQVQWTPTGSNLTHVEIRGNFHRQGDEIVVVNQPTNSTFIPAGFGFDISLEFTPVNLVNGRIEIRGNTVFAASSS
jgi:hypothetical protein